MSQSFGDAVADALQAALALPDASLVIYRLGLLVEFKTNLLLERLSLYESGGFKCWQVGPSDDHHCHPDLAAVTAVQFDAEPVSCQAGRLNYTVWFLGSGDCGNPYRPDGLFSVTLNDPYGPRGQHAVQAMFALYEQLRGDPLIGASDAFLSQRSGLPPAS